MKKAFNIQDKTFTSRKQMRNNLGKIITAAKLSCYPLTLRKVKMTKKDIFSMSTLLKPHGLDICIIGISGDFGRFTVVEVTKRFRKRH